MPAKWTGDIVASLHVNSISQKELAEHMGVSKEYVSLILHSKKNTTGMEARMKAAIQEILADRD